MESGDQIKRFHEFLEIHHHAEVLENLRKGHNYFAIDFNELCKFDSELAQDLLEDPNETIRAAELSIDNFELPSPVTNFRARFKNLPKSQKKMIRNIRSDLLNQFLCIEGIVRRKSDVRPQVTNAKFECPSCGNVINVLQLEEKFKEPFRCGCGRNGKFRLLNKNLIDVQRIDLEESPDELEGGDQPKRISLFLKEDLVSPLSDKKTNPGSKIRCTGIVKEIPISLPKGGQSTRFDLMIFGNHIEPIVEDFYEINVSKEEEDNILQLSQDPKYQSKLVESIAPSIYGHEKVKLALLLQAMGGVTKTRSDGMRTRGDIHVLLIGDPGAGKCLTSDSKLVLSDGSVKSIKSIFEAQKNKTFDDESYTLNEEICLPSFQNNARLGNNKATRLWIRKSPSQLLKITTSTGNILKVTKNHPFFTTKNSLIHSISASDLKNGDYLASPRRISIEGKLQNINLEFTKSKSNNKVIIKPLQELNKEFARLLGYLTGDGYVRHRKTGGIVSFTNKDKDLLLDFEKIILGLFNIKLAKRIKAGNDSVWEYYTSSVELVNYLVAIEKSITGSSKDMIIPEAVLKSPDYILREFLISLFECEAHISDREIQITSKSSELIETLKICLLRFGILSQISKKIKCATNTSNKIKRDYYELRISGIDVLRYQEKIGFISNYKKEKLKQICSVPKIRNTNKDIVPNLKDVLKIVRCRYNLAQKQMGVGRSAYLHYELGDRNPSRDNLIKIAKTLNRINPVDISIKLIDELANSDIFWDKIKHIEVIEANEEYVYDIEIENTHNFICNSVMVHNSQLLKRMAQVAPKARYVSGKGVSGAGLTATVVKDEFLRGWALEAGALPLSNNGFCMIDEMDKMTTEDRSAMHEALEQQSFEYNTMIMFADGSEQKIGEFTENLMNKYSKELIQGKDCIILPLREKIELFTTDWENIYPINIDRVSKHLASDHFIKITVGNGREIIVTPEHPLFHIENCQIKTIDAENAKLGMWVPVPLDIQIKGATQKFNIFKEDCFIERAQQHISVPMENGPNFFKIIGYMLAEGSKETNRGKLIGINFSNKDTRLLDDFEQSMMYLFNLKPYRQPRTDEYGTRYTTRYISRELAKFVEKICPEILNKASGKQIPAICLKGKKQDIALMLSCMFEGDGHVSKKPKTIRVGFASNSIKICKQVQDLLLRFSIRSNLTEHKESYKVSITGKNNIAKFYEDIKFVTKEKNKIIEDYLANIIAIRSIKNNVPGVATEVIDFMQKYGIKKLKNNLLATMKHDYLKRNKNISRGLLQELIKNIKPINEDQNKYEFLRKMAFGNIGFEKIISIETIKNNNQKWTYDVTIEPTHNFISQNLVLHNTISISKANIQATLKCATTVLAAANPKYGRFDPFEVIAKQINLPPALMSRFDLIFPIRDMPDPDKDKKTAMHMLKLHQAPMSQEAELSTDFLKKYICYARQRMHPVLTDGAVEEIEDYYLKMRSSGSTEGGTPTVPISPRQLEALIRLSEASAKLRMSDKVTRKDAKNASDILQNCLEAIGLDPDTGKLDIDRISSGISASQRGKIHQIKEIIDTIEKAIGEKNIPVDEIVKAAQAKNIEDSTVYEILEKLRISGDVFEPKRGFISKL